MQYKPQSIEKKWQERWRKNNLYKTGDNFSKPKYYVLDMFPYPSGVGLHVGHPKGYIATDIFSRFKRMKGFNVLHPMGWDAFGLPAENYALKNKVHPRVAVQKNIARYKEQLEMIGFSYDWSREINTTDPGYYKWTQWAFLKMWEKGLAFESYEPINWCPNCKTGLANEDLENGNCERCDSEVEQKPMRQWVLKITEYAEDLLAGLGTLDWEDSIKDLQRNWIGKSEGVEFELKIKGSDKKIDVYTTRIDTVFGMSYVVLSPENKLVDQITDETCRKSIVDYKCLACKKTILERTELEKDKSGVWTGAYAINPFNGKEVPVYISDYVVSGYGTGAVMAVPAHDRRDYEFAKKYDLEIIPVVSSAKLKTDFSIEPMVEEGVLFDSGDYSGLSSLQAGLKMAVWLQKKGIGGRKTRYKMRDWVFSRQRYWGEPIPIIHCPKCGVVPVPEDELPVKLPEVERYEPTDTGESPLANIEEWVNTKCPKCHEDAKRETNTMPQWAGSCWYYLRYIDPQNNSVLVNPDKEKYWMDVDLYVGGAEHATRHLLYARFWHKVLYECGVVSSAEPFCKLYHVGLIMGGDGRKMSKRWGNVINPDDVIAQYGADGLRLYEMFMGPFSDSIAWSTENIKGVSRFLDKVWQLKEVMADKEDSAVNEFLHKTIKKAGEDIEKFSFNTAISAMMIFVNQARSKITQHQLEMFLRILTPFAPHICEEIWEVLGNENSICLQDWPSYDKEICRGASIQFIVQVNGKLRAKMQISSALKQEDIERLVLKSDKIKKYITGKKIKRIIFVPAKLINILV